MCDLNAVIGLLGSAAGMIAGAIAAIAIAAALNNSFWAAGGAPVPMGVAAGLSAAAAAALVAAKQLVSDYFQCMGAPPECLAHFSNLQNVLDGLITVLGIQAIASGVAAASAWIPWVGAIPMYAIAGALAVQVVIIPTTVAYASDLISCADQSRRVASSALPLILTIGIELLVAWSLFYFPRRVRRRRTSALSGHDKY
jgi:hypothetical protein